MTSDFRQGFRLGVWKIEPQLGAVTGPDGDTQHLEPKVMDVFVCLAEHANELVTRDELLDTVWHGQVAADDLLTGAISDLRRVIQAGRGDPQYIETVPKRGYRLVGQILPLEDADLEGQDTSGSAVASSLQTRRPTLWLTGSALVVIAAVLIGLNVGGMRDRLFGDTTPKSVKSIAVMPFLDLSEDRTQRYFADGLSEEILNSLAKAPDLLVAARTSSFAFRDSQDDLPTIAAALGVDHVLEGSVRSGGDKLRITAQLIRANDGFHIWSETFDKTPENIIEIQEEIAIAIANVLETAMDPDALARMMAVDTKSVPAYEAYLTATGLWVASDKDIYLRLDAREQFERAVALDPEFTRAYDYLFWFWQLQLPTNNVAYRISGLTYEEIVQKRDEALANAIRTEKDASTLLKYQAHKAWVEFQPRRALGLINEFLERNPSARTGRQFRVVVMKALGFQDELDELVETTYTLPETEIREGRVLQSLNAMESSENKDLMRAVAYDAIERFGDIHGIIYQAHRVLLSAGDIEGARAILPDILSSKTWKRSQYFAQLRQACAELRIADATYIQAMFLQEFPEHLAVQWLSHKIIGNDEIADNLFRQYDERREFATMYTYLGYAHFDAKLYPNFMQALAGQGIEDRRVAELPYRCNR